MAVFLSNPQWYESKKRRFELRGPRDYRGIGHLTRLPDGMTLSSHVISDYTVHSRDESPYGTRIF